MTLVRKTLISVFDQAILSLGGLFLSVLLIRNASKHEYGEFGLAIAVILLISGFHNTLIHLPANIIGNKLDANGRHTFLGSHFLALYMIIIPLILLVILGLYVLSPSFIPLERSTLLVLSIAAVGILSREMLRSLFFATDHVPKVLMVDSVYFFSLIGLALALARTDLTAFKLILAMGFASGLSSIVLWMQARHHFKVSWPRVMPDLRKSWSESRWMFLGMLQSWILNRGYVFILAYILTKEAVAEVTAIYLLMAPLNLIVMAWGKVFLPHGAKLADGDQSKKAPRIVAKSTILLTSFAAIYISIAMVFSGLIEEMVFSGKYINIRPFVLLWGLFQIASIIRENSKYLLSILLKFKELLIVGLITGLLGLPLSVWLILEAGPSGAIISMTVSQIFLAALIIYLAYQAYFQKSKGHETTSISAVRN